MKVLLINDFSGIVGGAERLLEILTLEAQDENIQFYRIDISDLFEIPFSKKFNPLVEKYHRITILPKVVSKLTKRITEIDPDIIHLNNNNLFINSVAQCLQSLNIPVVYFIHDYYALQRLSSPFFSRYTNNFSFVTHNHDFYNTLIEKNRKAYLVSVPFNHVRWKPMVSERTHPIVDLLYVGRLEKQKGIFKLIRAVRQIKKIIPSISLTMVGEGTERRKLEHFVRRKKLNTNIQLKGLLPEEEIRQYYAKSRLLVLPSPAESLGYVGLEAQSSGIPVIAFANHGTERWCEDNYNGFIVKGTSSQKLAQKVLEIIYDDVILTRISTAARENISLKKYNASTQKITDIYKALLLW